jgi:hypothetical protein
MRARRIFLLIVLVLLIALTLDLRPSTAPAGYHEDGSYTEAGATACIPFMPCDSQPITSAIILIALASVIYLILETI